MNRWIERQKLLAKWPNFLQRNSCLWSFLHFVRVILFLLWQLHVIVKRFHRFASSMAKVATAKKKQDINKSACFTHTNMHTMTPMNQAIYVPQGVYKIRSISVLIFRFSQSISRFRLGFFVRGDRVNFFPVCAPSRSRWAFNILTEPRVCFLPFVYLVGGDWQHLIFAFDVSIVDTHQVYWYVLSVGKVY